MVCHPLHRKDGRGLTLVELLCVIAVIALLMLIAFPVSNRMRAAAVQAECVTNQRSVVAAARLFATDHEDKLPAIGDIAQGVRDATPQGLITQLLPYAEGATKIFYCPDCQSRGNTYEYQHAGKDIVPYWRMGYYWLVASSGGGFPTRPELPQTIGGGDAQRLLLTCYYSGSGRPHGGKIYGAFADGHVNQLQGTLSGHSFDFRTLTFK